MPHPCETCGSHDARPVTATAGAIATSAASRTVWTCADHLERYV